MLALGEQNNFADLYNASESDSEKLTARLKLKRLIYPEGMGTVFKALVLHRGVPNPHLSGLRYVRSQDTIQ